VDATDDRGVSTFERRTTPRGGGGTRPGVDGWFSRAWIAAVVVAATTIFLLTGSVAFALAPAAVVVIGVAFWRLPLRYPAFVFLFATLVVPEPARLRSGAPAASGPLWTALMPIDQFLQANLNLITGISALRFSGADLIRTLMLLLALARVIRGSRVDAAGRISGVNALFACSAAAVFWIAVMEGWGMARGGDPDQSLWQFRQILWVPVLTCLFSYCLRGRRDFLALAGIVTAAALLKVALGVYFLVHDALPNGFRPEFITGHDDTVLYVIVMFMWAAAWLLQPSVRRFLFLLLVWSWIGVGIVLNGRRLAYVSLGATLLVSYWLLRGRPKRIATRMLLCAAPLFGLYLLVARTHSSGIFAPGASIMSLSQHRDASSLMRDIENFNLVQTVRQHQVVGSGWGHEYLEVSKGYDISKAFEQYRFIPHNSILWTLSVGGIVGFVVLWMPFVVGAFLAARSYYLARDAFERTAALSMIAALIAYLNQAWGDMGTQSVGPGLLVAFALAAAGKLARHTGAWPAGARLMSREVSVDRPRQTAERPRVPSFGTSAASPPTPTR
jgi:hypothetical protein